MRRYGLRDDQWERIWDLLPGQEGHVCVTAAGHRLFVEAVLYRHRADLPWRGLPELFGDWKNVRRRHSRWAKSGGQERVFQYLAGDADNEYAMIDSTVVRASAQRGRPKRAAGYQAIGRSRGCPSTEIHTMVDALGNPVGFLLTGGQAHDLQGAGHLFPGAKADTLIADKAFDADKRVLEPLAAAGKAAVIPPKANRVVQSDYYRHLYKARHLIESFFAKLKQVRAIATRYDKTPRNFLAGIDSLSITLNRPLIMERFLCWVDHLLALQGDDILRVKGVLDFEGQDRRFLFQAVHRIADGVLLDKWPPGERRPKLVFIGRNPDRDRLRRTVEACLIRPRREVLDTLSTVQVPVLNRRCA